MATFGGSAWPRRGDARRGHPWRDRSDARGAWTSAGFGSGPILGAARFVSRAYEHSDRLIWRSKRASAATRIRSLYRRLSWGSPARLSRRVASPLIGRVQCAAGFECGWGDAACGLSE